MLSNLFLRYHVSSIGWNVCDAIGDQIVRIAKINSFQERLKIFFFFCWRYQYFLTVTCSCSRDRMSGPARSETYTVSQNTDLKWHHSCCCILSVSARPHAQRCRSISKGGSPCCIVCLCHENDDHYYHSCIRVHSIRQIRVSLAGSYIKRNTQKWWNIVIFIKFEKELIGTFKKSNSLFT